MANDLSRRGVLAVLAASACVPAMLRAAQVTKGPIAFDALGEIRTVYTPDLVRQILASGTRAIAVTITDPKTEVPQALAQLRADLARYEAYLSAHPDLYIRARRIADVERAQAEGKLAVFYNLQNSTPIERDLSRIRLLQGLGITSVQITYNTHNFAGSGCFEEVDGGLTPFGRELVAGLNEAGVLVDLSHAGMRTMADTIVASKRPVIVSHTACKALRPHRRNTTDENLRALAQKGGVVGITQIRTFLTDARRDNLEPYFQHIDHAVKVAGIEHVGIGSDRDHRVIPDNEAEIQILLKEEGAQFKPADWPLYLERLNGPRRMDVIRDELRRRKYSQADIDRLMGANVHRLYREIIG